MTTPSLVVSLLILIGILAPNHAFASAAQQCKQKAAKLKDDCNKAFEKARSEAMRIGGEFGSEAQSVDAIHRHAGSYIGAADKTNDILGATEQHCEKKEKECSDVCKQEKGKDAKEKKEIGDALKDCKEKIQEKKKALKGGQQQNQQAKEGAGKTQEGSGSDKKQEGGEQKQGGQGGAPPGGAPPPSSPPSEPKTAENQQPTRMPGDNSGATGTKFADNECNGSSFGAVNPNCVPGSGTPTNGTAVASVEDPLKKKCLSGDNSPECQNYRASTAGLAPASTGSAGGGGGGGATASGTQARLDPDIKIPLGQGTPESQGLGNLGVDSAGGHGGYGGAGGSSSSSLEESLFGSKNSGSGLGSPGRGIATASAVASDVAANPGPSVISIVSMTIRNWCTSKAVPNCGPRPGR